MLDLLFTSIFIYKTQHNHLYISVLHVITAKFYTLCDSICLKIFRQMLYDPRFKHFRILLLTGGNLSSHSTLFYKQPNRNFWSFCFLRFYAVFYYDNQMTVYHPLCYPNRTYISLCRNVISQFYCVDVFPNTVKRGRGLTLLFSTTGDKCR